MYEMSPVVILIQMSVYEQLSTVLIKKGNIVYQEKLDIVFLLCYY